MLKAGGRINNIKKLIFRLNFLKSQNERISLYPLLYDYYKFES